MNICNKVKNNTSTNELVAFLKNSKDQYKNLSKNEEREMIDRYRYTDDEKLRNLLVLHNMRYVFNLAKKYAQQTSDFDDLIAKGMLGLVMASKKFNLDMPITKKTPIFDDHGNPKMIRLPKMKKDRSSGKMIPVLDKKTGEQVYTMVQDEKTEIQYEPDGITPKYVKFNTFATWWILKYIRREFNDEKEITVNNKFISICKVLKESKDSNSESCTLENYLNSVVSPDVSIKSAEDELSNVAINDVCQSIFDFVDTSTQLSAADKQIFFDTFYSDKKTKDIANDLHSNLATIANRKKKVMEKIRNMLSSRFNIHSMDDILVR